MATTGVNIIKYLVASLVNATVGAIGSLGTMNPTSAAQLEATGQVSRLDHVLVDLAVSAYAKNGGGTVSLSGTTAKTIDLTDLTSVTASYAGDTTFATVNQLVIRNTGAGSLTIAPGGSNPFSIWLGGTSPTITIDAGSTWTMNSAAGKTVDSTHKTILITPAADTTFTIAVGGA